MKRVAFALCLTAALTACTPRGTLTLFPEAAAVGSVQEIYVGTTRAIDPETGNFGAGKSETTSFARYAVSVPPQRELGEITFPPRRARPDPARHFLTVEQEIHANARTFRSDLTRSLQAYPRGNRDAVIFVHGFNNNFSEGLYRIAQLDHDITMPGVAVHYSWPSAGNPLGYVHDRDAALFARDGLEGLINQVLAAGADRILLVAHSMGAALAMEALRQIAIRGDTRLKSRLSGVVLISPDIDVDVFRAQARAMGALPQPFLIFGSNRDGLLGLSARLTGQSERLGNLPDVSRIADLEVTFFETAAFSTGVGHFTLGDSPALIQLIARIGEVDAAFGSDQQDRVGLLPGVVLTVQSATQVVLAPVVVVGQELSR